jgi:hypothetical protein
MPRRQVLVANYFTGKSNYGGQIGIGIDPKTKFIAKIGLFDPDPDSIKIKIAVILHE